MISLVNSIKHNKKKIIPILHKHLQTIDKGDKLPNPFMRPDSPWYLILPFALSSQDPCSGLVCLRELHTSEHLCQDFLSSHLMPGISWAGTTIWVKCLKLVLWPSLVLVPRSPFPDSLPFAGGLTICLISSGSHTCEAIPELHGKISVPGRKAGKQRAPSDTHTITFVGSWKNGLSEWCLHDDFEWLLLMSDTEHI